MGKKHHNSQESKKAKIYDKIADLRSYNKDFNSLVSEIDSKFEQFISKKNSASFKPKRSTECKINVTVTAVPITANEKDCLLEYLHTKYIHSVGGDYFSFKKCYFSKKYRIKSYYYSDDDFLT